MGEIQQVWSSSPVKPGDMHISEPAILARNKDLPQTRQRSQHSDLPATDLQAHGDRVSRNSLSVPRVSWNTGRSTRHVTHHLTWVSNTTGLYLCAFAQQGLDEATPGQKDFSSPFAERAGNTNPPLVWNSDFPPPPKKVFIIKIHVVTDVGSL